ncbi:MAG: roadblock/LC7 domain-containing protein, partial [Acidobacteriota bacterium]
ALGLSRRIAQTVHLGDFQEVVIRGGEGYLVVYGAGEKAVLAVSIPSSVNLGLIHLEARDRATQIAAILEAS